MEDAIRRRPAACKPRPRGEGFRRGKLDRAVRAAKDTFMRTLLWVLIAPLACSCLGAEVVFKKVRLTDEFWAEGADAADFNRDGHIDVVSGPYWYAGPDFKRRHEFWPAEASFTRKKPGGGEEILPGFEGGLGEKNAYSECFLTFAFDFNQDGWPDVMVYGYPGKPAFWYENPKGRAGHWQRHLALAVLDNESPGLADVTGDGRPEILCCSQGYIGYAEADWKRPDRPWTFHPVSPKGDYQRFTHGIGCGDINGDQRADILEKDGWWEQPAARAGDPVWKFHPFPFAPAAAQMYACDINGDGLADVVTCINAHGYGLSWFEQTRPDGKISFREHVILRPDATPNALGVVFSQPHGLAVADVDGDGLPDLVTGKRFWAHGKDGPDPDSNGPAVLYWFQLTRPAPGRAEFVAHRVDDDSGVGTQVTVARVSNPRHPDLVVGNKKGVFLFQRQ